MIVDLGLLLKRAEDVGFHSEVTVDGTELRFEFSKSGVNGHFTHVCHGVRDAYYYVHAYRAGYFDAQGEK